MYALLAMTSFAISMGLFISCLIESSDIVEFKINSNWVFKSVLGFLFQAIGFMLLG